MTQLRRDLSNHWIAGVCSGIGEALNVDPIIIRVIWIAAILIGGSGLLAYLIAWILIPNPPLEASLFPEKSETNSRTSKFDGSRVLGIVLIVIALVWLAHKMDFIPFISWSYLWPLVLIVVGVALLLRPMVHKAAESQSGSNRTIIDSK